MPAETFSCVYCGASADGTFHDVYGEHELRRGDLVVCASCDDDLASEHGPWSGWGD